ncbi:MAG: 5-oxoprolinase subunit PxpA [Marinilabiliaceae bacterium]|jgi:UPF0271 protein|nr:5-oxoprolinase subunit PxpA [Marinilabiliaceae bacterium]
MKQIDLNADVGEGFMMDKDLMKHISSANIACGLHAGSPALMYKTVKLALKAGVSIGAHPGFPDREGFGRKPIKMSPAELQIITAYQLGSLSGIVSLSGAVLKHVKAHGALYNMAAKDITTARAIITAIKKTCPGAKVFGPWKSELEKACRESGLDFVSEVFADRAYNNDGSLVDRNIEGAVIHDVNECIGRVITMLEEGKVKSIKGDYIDIVAETICLHGDNREALVFAENLRKEINSRAYIIRAR